MKIKIIVILLLAFLALALLLTGSPAAETQARAESPDQVVAEAKAQLKAGLNAGDFGPCRKARDLFLRGLMSAGDKKALFEYYVALADFRIAVLAMRSGLTAEAEAMVGEGRKYLENAAAADPLFGEVFALQGYLAGLEIALHPDRAMSLGMAVFREFAKAEEKGAANPRVFLLKGSYLLYVPEPYGGGPDNALPSLEKSAALFEKEISADPLMPDWGKDEVFLYLGLVFKRKNDPAKAGEMFRKALAVNPDFGWARAELSELEKTASSRPTETRISTIVQKRVSIGGKVVDRETKDPLPAFVLAPGGPGVSAGADGRFALSLENATSSKILVTAWLLGYKKKEFEAVSGVFLTVELDLEPLDAREVTVTADSVVSDERGRKTVTLTKMDIYTLPGTAADPINAGHLLPGVNAPPDASSMLIRGGAPDEVGYYFDGIEIRHPFLSESLHESYFSIFDNQVVDRFSVSTTGFHPRYGDALSGVMEIAAKDNPARREGGLGLSVLGLTSYAAFPVTENGSFVGSYDRGFSDILTKLNSRGGGREFGTEHLFGKFRWRLNPSNELRLYGLADRYRYAQANEASFDVATRNALAAVSWTSTPARNLVLKTILATLRYDVSFDQPDIIQVASRDSEIQSRFEGLWDLGRHYLEFGADVQKRDEKTNIEGGEPIEIGTEATRIGLFFHDKFRLSDRVFVNAGARISHLDLVRRGWSFDPRLSAAFLLRPNSVIRLSAGLYRQAGDYETLQKNPGLFPKSAVHFALSYDRIVEGAELRISIYDKEYRRLFLAEAGGGVGNGGRGYARGAEFFVKRNAARFEALLVYNYLFSRRKEGDVPVLAPSPYAIDHSATAIVRWKPKNGSLGLRFSVASGRPFTPLLDREWDSETQSFLPVWGPPYSRRYPFYQRLDLNGSWNVRLFGLALVAYFGVTNVLDSRNILRYDYAGDYGERLDQTSIFGRSLFAGLYVPLF